MSVEPHERKLETVEQKAWHALDAQEVLRDLKVHEGGLTAEQASERLERYGTNELQSPPRPGFWATLSDQLIVLS